MATKFVSLIQGFEYAVRRTGNSDAQLAAARYFALATHLFFDPPLPVAFPASDLTA
jgi:hypothetical protein